MALHSTWMELESDLDLLAIHVRDFAASSRCFDLPLTSPFGMNAYLRVYCRGYGRLGAGSVEIA